MTIVSEFKYYLFKNNLKHYIFLNIDIIFPYSECDLDSSVDNNKHFENILKSSSLAQDLKSVFEGVVTNGIIKLKVNDWVDVSFCLPHKVHHFYRDGQYFEPESINKWEHV